MSEKRKISREGYLQLVGLLTLAEQHNKALADIEKAAVQITGEAQEYDGPGGRGEHTSDEIYGRNCSADDLLERLNIGVEEGETHGG